ncbi:hypothetical protein X880_1580 [Burkholderia pseudomallei MSHR4032]|nr:hypothetical protein DP44_574 [Burkholderia pseudomallei]KGR92829.1 hypothetical protein X948_1614 [Burkholderia pseudomallei MSHR5608]KGS83002.1 hypothetical protein X947_763 [Burkholderia pseudomallei MSHR7334]KGU99533.1 hypothetical protein X880_1580 [Burkholderia pseudomallei MSHR4032]KGV07694.1 hypothetical protein X895_2164 [Burkholderia pseudomallei MSHR4503]
MASVTIDMGSGKRATLTSAGNSTGMRPSVGQRSAVSALMLHWPKYSGLTTGAAGYLRELGIGAFHSDPVAALRSAIEDGRVSVSIDQPVARGGSAGGSPSTPPFPRANRLASVPGVTALPVDKPLPSWATPSNVTADELISYLESVVAGAGSSLASNDIGGASSLLGEAAPFELAADVPDDGSFILAGTPNTGPAGSWYTNPGSGQMRLFGNNGLPAVDFDFDHDHGQGIPHAHNWDDVGGGFPVRGPGVSFSPLP